MKLLDYKTWNVKKILKEIAVMALMVFVIANALSYIRKPELSDSRFPQISEKLIRGEQFDSADLRDRPLLVHFWATWCPACKAEADNIQRLSKYYDVVTFAVKSGDDSALQTFMDEREYDYKVINDGQGQWAGTFNVEAFPTTFIYDADGELMFSEVGYTSTLGLLLRMWWARL